MRKTLLFVFFLLLCIGIKAQDWEFEEKELDVCYTVDKSREHLIYGVIRIDEIIGGHKLLMYHDTSVGVMEVCPHKNIAKRYKPNSIRIGTNVSLLFEEKLKKVMGMESIDSYIPQKLFYLKKGHDQFIIIELYLFMPCSINGISGGYNSIFIRLDENDVIKGFSVSEFYRRSYTKNTLVNFLEKSF